MPAIGPAEAVQIVLICFGLIGIIGNGLILLVGFKNKKMRDKEYHLPYMLAFSEWVLSFAAFLSAVHLLYRLLTNHYGMFYTASDCILWPYFHCLIISFMLIPASNVAVCIDRLICIQAPLYYYQLTSTYTKRVCAFVLAACFGFWLAILAAAASQGSSFFKRPMHVHCSPIQLKAVVPFYIAVHYISLIGSVAVVLMVIVMLALFVNQKRALKSLSTGVHEQARKRNDRVTKMLLYSLAFSIFCNCIPSVGMTFIAVKGGDLNLMRAFFILTVLNTVNNIGLYVWKNKDMRVAVLALLGAKAKVTPVEN